MKLDLTEAQHFMLAQTCLEEMKYYQRCVMVAPGLKGQEAIDAGNRIFDKHDKVRDVLMKATATNAQEYKQIADKLAHNDADFDRKQLDKLRMMLQEIPALYDRHVLVKEQIDGTVTRKYVHEVLIVAYEAARRAVLDQYQEILRKVNNLLNGV